MKKSFIYKIFFSGLLVAMGFSTSSFAQELPMVIEKTPGSLLIQGQAGPSQLFGQVKAQRCEKVARKCDAPIYFGLNTEIQVPSGNYMLGFENSIYPGWVQVLDGVVTTIDLMRVEMPVSMQGQAQVRIFRDFTTKVEMNKVLWTQFYLGKPMFHLGAYSFGDLYLTDQFPKSVTARLNYDACAKAKTSSSDPDVGEVIKLCNAFNSAKSPQDLSVFFRPMGLEYNPHLAKTSKDKFDDRGKLAQIWVYGSSLKTTVILGRHLVSAPMRGTDFVSVFPGSYRIMADGVPTATVEVSTGGVVESYK